ncbi:MAG: glutamate-1-semialdehyde 2,1-aminomutase [Candidatus Binatus sp.]|uniref:glutamate-1-semialdehyde 2,1-aminomutase n=1 Tax=Candidatus Binatus sp. TaxID=2811406 RepID=UPI002716CCA9|nr:glutamate-1-semialdehyde 2,1-aminomutase [Candidatus Binatus sp.]MDO8431943.1 glutamate-1-semialdehyde 2,1-aminomutase [Candidatus Binatus sp.]
MQNSETSRELFNRAKVKIPGAVNSPVRAWNAVGESPLFIESGAGASLTDADGRQFLDYVCSYGPAILGHAHPRVTAALAHQARSGLGFGAPTRLEVELAELISSAIGCAEKVRLVSSGTEAGMTALRIARAATGRPNIVKFDGCYHGHSDSLLVRAGSGGMTLGQPDSGGVPAALAALTMVARYNAIENVENVFRAAPDKIAAVIVEPVAANMGVVNPLPGFLHALAEIAHRNGALLICDEVISGFRLNFGSASEAMGVTPDLIMLGKIIGGGMPIGAVAGPSRLMDLLAPIGPVYQAGTLSGNPLSVRAGLETLSELRETNPYPRLEELGAQLERGLSAALDANREPGCVNRAGSLLTMFFGPERVTDADEARTSDSKKFAKFFHAMIARGINIPPSQFEAMFISTAHTDADIDRTIAAATEALRDTNQGRA